MGTLSNNPLVSPFNRLGNAFRPEDAERLASRIEHRVPFYVRMQISPFEASAGRLLHAIANGDRTPATNYHTFFCSSTWEAISGALKLVRHNRFLGNPSGQGLTLVLDPTGELESIFDPFGKGPQEALVPGLIYYREIDAFREGMDKHLPFSILVRHAHTWSLNEVSSLIRAAQDEGQLTILDESAVNLASDTPLSSRIEAPADVLVWGENLTDHRAPAGCILMSRSVYQVWDAGSDYNIHSNTWGGNSASLALMLDFLKQTPAVSRLPESVLPELQDAVNSHQKATSLYATYCSSKMATMLNISGLNKNIQSAERTKIRTLTRRGPQDVIDASGTYGVNLHGHNPQEVIEEVIRQHDPDVDYWTKLESLLSEKTGLAKALPAVSGTTAVETALTMGLLAGAPKKKVIALKGGFGGKTLISLISTSRDRFKIPFGPLYPHIVYVDPFDGQGEQQLHRELESGEVAMVILETVQGEGGVRACPPSFIDALNRWRREYEFSIAVDEIQTGMYRTGRFLNYQGKLDTVDIIAMGKAMSENVFPVSATLTSQSVYERARATNEDLVERYSNFYRCQFGAHIALHAVQVGEQLGLAAHASEVGQYFLEKMRVACRDLPFVREVRGEGLMVGMEFVEEKLPRLLRKSFGGLIAARCVNDSRQPVLLAYNPDKPFLIRFVPPLCITKEEVDAVVDTTRRALHSSVFGLLRPILVNTVGSKLGRLG